MNALTETELRIMTLLWEQSPRSVRELAIEIYNDDGDSKTASIQKLLKRLVDKQCVSRTQSGRPHLYTATVSRRRHVADQLRRLADRHFGGRLTSLATTLFGEVDLDDQQRSKLRDLIDHQWPGESEIEDEPAAKKPGRGTDAVPRQGDCTDVTDGSGSGNSDPSGVSE